MVAMLEIKLLGSPQLLMEGQVFTGLRRKNRALLFYLAAQSLSLAFSGPIPSVRELRKSCEL